MNHGSKILLSDRRYDQERVYWSEVLRHPINHPLSTDWENRSGDVTGFWHEVDSVVPDAVADWILKLSKGSDHKVYLVFYGLVLVYLHKLSGSSLLTVACPVEKQNEIPKINSFVLMQGKVDDEQSFQQLLGSLRLQWMEAIRNSEFPLLSLLEQLWQGETEQVFRTSITMDSLHDLEYFPTQPKLNFIIVHENDVFKVKLNFSANLLTVSLAEKMLEDLNNLSLWVVSHSTAPIKVYSLVDRTESRPASVGNLSQSIKRLTIGEEFSKVAFRCKRQVALEYEDRSLTYEELEQQSNRLANWLIHNGLCPGDRVGILLERSEKVIILMLAVLKAGGSYIPLDLTMPEERIKFMLSCSEAKLVIVDKKQENWPYDDFSVQLQADQGYHFSEEFLLAGRAHVDSLAYTIFTSGTTGRPKGVLIEHQQVLQLVDALYQDVFMENLSGRRVAVVAPFFFDASVQQIFSALLSGATLSIVPENARSDGDALLNFLINDRIEFMDGTPSHLKMLLFAGNGTSVKNLQVKQWLIGGDALYYEDVYAFYGKFDADQLSPLITNVYGPTECCVDCSYYHVRKNGPAHGRVEIGYPLGSNRLYILNQAQEVVPDGFSGEIFVAGPGVGRGYAGDDELTSEKFLPDLYDSESRMYRTGDLGRVLETGQIETSGRVDHQIKLNGYRIEPGEVEMHLKAVAGIRDAVVVAIQRADWQYGLVSYYLSDGKPLLSETLSLYLRKQIPDYMVPGTYIQLREWPLLPNGKLNRVLLTSTRFIEQNWDKSRCIPPRNDLEREIHALWISLFKVDTISVTSTFFEVGGNSLIGMRLAYEIQERYKIPFTVNSLFSNPTIEQLCTYINSQENNIHRPLQLTEKMGDYPVAYQQKSLFFQQWLYPSSIQYNMPHIFMIPTAIDLKRMSTAAEQLAVRHEMLRMRFSIIDHELRMIPEDHTKIECKDLGLIENLSATFFQFIRPFDLNSAPLLRIAIGCDAEGRGILFLDIHHIAADGESCELLLRDLFRFYAGETLEPLPLQYKDYACELISRLESNQQSVHLQFWEEEARRASKRVSVTHHSPVVIQQLTGARFEVPAPPEISQLVNVISKELQVTSYSVYLSVYLLLQSKLSGVKNVSTGIVMSGRPGELEKVVGMFVHTLPFLDTIDEHIPFTQWAAQVFNKLVQLHRFKEYPLDEIFPGDKWAEFDTVFLLREDARVQEENILTDICAVHDQVLKESEAKFKLSFELVTTDQQLKAVIEYKKDMIERGEVELILERYWFLLQQVTKDAGQALASYTTLLPSERKELNARINDALYDMEVSIDI